MRYKDIVVASAMLASGVIYYAMSARVQNRDGVDASTVPTILAVMMIALGVIEMISALRRRRAEATPAAMGDPAESIAAGHGDMAEHAAGPPPARPDIATVLMTLALIAAYAALLTPLGFPVATAIYLFVQFLLLTPRRATRSLPLYAVVALAASVIIYATFRYGFDLLLPAGPLTALLP